MPSLDIGRMSHGRIDRFSTKGGQEARPKVTEVVFAKEDVAIELSKGTKRSELLQGKHSWFARGT